MTISHLRFGDKPIQPYYINQADFVACHNLYIHMGMKMVRMSSPAAYS